MHVLDMCPALRSFSGAAVGTPTCVGNYTGMLRAFDASGASALVIGWDFEIRQLDTFFSNFGRVLCAAFDANAAMSYAHLRWFDA